MQPAALPAEIRSAFRQLRRSPAFSMLAIGLLAAGVGAVALVYSVVNGVLLRPLPFHRPAELVGFQSLNQGRSIVQPALSAADFRDLAERCRSFSALGAYRPDFATWTRPGAQPVQLTAALVTEGFFPSLGVAAATGRTFGPGDFPLGAPRAAVLSHAAWLRRFDGDPAVVGRTVVLNEQPHTIVGVMPRKVREPAVVDVWLAFPPESPEYFARDSRFWVAVGRLAPGVSLSRAGAEVATIATDLARSYPETNRGWTLRIAPLQEMRVANLRRSLWALLAATSLLLLVACSNLANLLLARGLRRLDEMAVRRALGATSGTLLRQVLLENALLGLAGGALGIGGAFGVVVLFVRRLPPHLVPRANEITVDAGVVFVVAALSVVAGLVSGALPAWQAARSEIGAVLKESGGRTGPGIAIRRLQGGLVAAQVALTFVVLAGAALLGRGLVGLQVTDTGFRPANVLTLRVAPPSAQFESSLDLARYFERIVDAVALVPGVEAAAVDASAPLAGVTLRYPYTVVGEPPPSDGANEAVLNPVSPGFFDTLALPLRAGRMFTTADDERGRPVIIVNETLARRIAPAGEALGRRLRLVPWLSQSDHEIVGIVGDVRQENLADAPPAQYYVPQRQATWFFSTLLVRVRDLRSAPLAALRAAIGRVDPGVATEFVPLEEAIGATALSARLATGLLAGLGALAFGLTLLGVYASLAFAVAQRTREFGLRQALGASPAAVLRLVVGEALRLLAVGLAIGGAGVLAFGGALRHRLPGIGEIDPVLLAAVGGALALATVGAAAAPALRAAFVPPAVALRRP